MCLPSIARGRVVLLVVVASLLLVPSAGHGVPGAADDVPPWPFSPLRYDWPLPATPTVGFLAPAGPYGPGHRGVDLPVTAGQPVHPMADGILRWSGEVAGETWASVQHPDGVTTSYGPLEPMRPRTTLGPVSREDVIGRARGDAHGRPGLLHVGARRQGRYVDPAALVAGSPAMIATLVGPGEVAVDPPVRPARRVTLVPGTPLSPNHLVVVAGLTSGTAEVPFDLHVLGYGDGHWSQFSYVGVDEHGDPIPYDHEDTWMRVHDAAVALRDQLRAFAAGHPGQAVDLAAHSLGGLVSMYYLLVLHDPTDPTLPPIGKVVTVASPLEGASSANAVAMVRTSPVATALLGLLVRQYAPEMAVEMPVLGDLRSDSAVVGAVRDAWQRYLDDPYASPLATGTDVFAIGEPGDLVVNDNRSSLPGMDHESVGSGSLLGAHSAVPHDPRTVELMTAFLAGEPMPGRGPGEHLTSIVAGPVAAAVAVLEYGIAALVLDHAS